MVIKRGPSEGLSLMNTHSTKNAFFKASSIEIYFTNILILSVAFPFPGVVKCWCGTIATMFSQAAQWDSHDLCRFSLVDVPSRWWRQLHVVRAISYVLPPRWQSGEICQAMAAVAFMMLNYALWFSPKGGWSPFCSVLLSCQRVTCSTIPVFSAWHCVLPLLSVVATGFPGHAGGWHLRKKPCVVLLPFSSIAFACGGTCPVVSGNLCVISLQTVLKCEGFANT